MPKKAWRGDDGRHGGAISGSHRARPAPPCPILPCPAYHAPLRCLPSSSWWSSPPSYFPLWIRIPQQRSLRNYSFHRCLAPRQSIDRSCSPLLHFPISDPLISNRFFSSVLLSFVQTCRIKCHTNLTEKTEFPERASSSVSDLCIDICSFLVFPFFDSSPFASPFALPRSQWEQAI